MELQGETVIAAPRDRVWAALNDPAVLQRCIEGAESLERVGDNRFEGKLNAKVGPVRATFTGGVTLENLDPPNGYTLSGEGKGGVAGFAKGSADVRLSDETLPDGSAGTRLAYTARSTVGGKLAQLGTRLIEGTARSYAENFFARLKEEVERPAEPIAVEVEEDTPPNVAIGSDTAEAVAITSAAMTMGAPVLPIAPAPPTTADEESGKGIPPLVWGGALTILLILFIWLMLAT